MDPHKIFNDVYLEVAEANGELAAIWYTDVVFTWRWWLSIALTVIPWTLWIILHDKRNTVRLLFTGSIVIMITSVWDIVGISQGLWHYDWKIFPVIPTYLPWDFSLYPVGVMFFLQVKPKMNAYIKALIYAVTGAFILEPIFYIIGLYDKLNWKYWYSFVIYFFLYLLFNFIYTRKKLKACSSE